TIRVALSGPRGKNDNTRLPRIDPPGTSKNPQLVPGYFALRMATAWSGVLPDRLWTLSAVTTGAWAAPATEIPSSLYSASGSFLRSFANDVYSGFSAAPNVGDVMTSSINDPE